MRKLPTIQIEICIGPADVGEFYLVPCVRWRDQWWPVIGPKHEDAEHIDFPDHHWHHDWRFVPDEFWCEMTRTLTGQCNLMSRVVIAEANYQINATGPIAYHRKKCLREMPKFPVHYMDHAGNMQKSPFAPKLENAYAKARVKNTSDCLRCPHRGVALNGLPQNADGVVVCPGHGLAWNLSTGKLVRRVRQGAKP